MESLIHLLQTLEAAMTAAEVTHSLRLEALKDPALEALPAMELFAEAGLDHLNALAGTAGFVRRILAGDVAPETWHGLHAELRLLHPAHLAVCAALADMEAEQEHELLETLRQVLAVVNRAHQAVMAAAAPLTTIEVR